MTIGLGILVEELIKDDGIVFYSIVLQNLTIFRQDLIVCNSRRSFEGYWITDILCATLFQAEQEKKLKLQM